MYQENHDITDIGNTTLPSSWRWIEIVMVSLIQSIDMIMQVLNPFERDIPLFARFRDQDFQEYMQERFRPSIRLQGSPQHPSLQTPGMITICQMTFVSFELISGEQSIVLGNPEEASEEQAPFFPGY